ncbi:hypothetical protein PSNVIR_03926 [Pseudomonas sp. Nvir]|nr:hypothetical protein PSNVIR_03926 [Pseudomonas sp. Nvir]
MVPGKGSRSIFSACEIERRPRGAIASCARSNRRYHTLWQTPVSPKAIPVGAGLPAMRPAQAIQDSCPHKAGAFSTNPAHSRKLPAFAQPRAAPVDLPKVPAMPWLQVRLAISPEQAETYEDALLEVGAVSVTFMDAEDQPIFEPDLNTTPLWSHTHLLALFEADTDAEQVFAHLRMLTGAELPEHQAEVIEDQDWERSWMDNFQPMRFGRRLWIVPSWHDAPEKDAVNLLLDPGLAFGTGTHPTTALCLEWLDGQQLEGTQVLDFGCGSGILAIAALLLGAREAVGTDIDVQAIEASRDNAQRNGIADEKLALYLPEHMPAMQADVLVANILAGPLVSLAPQLSGLVRPGGLLALSGILAEQGEEVAAAYAADFDLDPIVVRDGWVRISGRRR